MTTPTKLTEAHTAAVAAADAKGDPTERYTALADLAAWHDEQRTAIEQLLHSPT